MKNAFSSLIGILLSCLSATAAVHYVNVSNPAPASPYTTWATAATTIQAAVDVAVAGDQILVTNGIYNTGGRAVYESMTNRLAVTSAVTVQSVNGPVVTVIQGYQVPGTTNGSSAIRCVYLANGAVLAGFTLTNGATSTSGDVNQYESGGGVWCASSSAVVSNCVIVGNSASYYGGGAYSGTLTNCTLAGNSAIYGGGGGAYSATLNNCTLTGNSASGSNVSGGGTYSGTLNNCTLTGNSASNDGGGAYSGTLTNCTLTSNLALGNGGGAYSATLSNCSLSGNSAILSGGGAYSGMLINCTLTGNLAVGGGGACYGTLNNCILSGNSATGGGGACAATLNNCTLTANSAIVSGGGSSGGTLNNCIVCFNSSSLDPNETNYSGSTLNYCCTMPLPTSGVGNITADPKLATISHLSAGSPCRGAGSASYATGVDIDGEPWANPPCIGCDQFCSGGATGTLVPCIQAAYTNVAVGFALNFVGNNIGDISASAWNFGDGTVVSNQPYCSHAWTTAGDYTVSLRGYNASNPAGVAASILVHVITQPVHYVALTSLSPTPPYTSWATAATNIQDAVDAAVAGATVWVSNGVYACGGRAAFGLVTNRVAVTKPLTVQSVNGAAVTIIQGGGHNPVTGTLYPVRCVYLTNGAALVGFALTNGTTCEAYDYYDDYQDLSGGGVWCASSNAVVSDCVIVENAAYVYGGGAFLGTLNNCTLTNNLALVSGGGAYSSTLNNCTVTGNSGNWGGTCLGTLNNCIVYYNSGGNYYPGTLNYCCTTPLPGAGVGNFTNAPLFVNQAGGNYHLLPSSPCINAGYNAYVSTATDLDGNPRIVGGTVDVGAYEFQGPGGTPFSAWLQQYGLPTDGSVDYADSDGDGMINWQKWIAGVNPTNTACAFKMLSPANQASGVTVRWVSVTNKTYFLERATSLNASPAFSLLQSNLPGQPGLTTFTDTNASGPGPFFYRVGVTQ